MLTADGPGARTSGHEHLQVNTLLSKGVSTHSQQEVHAQEQLRTLSRSPVCRCGQQWFLPHWTYRSPQQAWPSGLSFVQDEGSVEGRRKVLPGGLLSSWLACSSYF